MKRTCSFVSGLFCLLLLIPFGHVQAASITSYQLGGVLSSDPADAGAQIDGDRRIFAQAVNPASPGFVVENGSGQWAFPSSDGNATSNVLTRAIEITGEPALLGVPGEVGSFAIGAGNAIEDLITKRYYHRPVIFLQVRDPALNAGVAVVPAAPLMAWNKFKFTVHTTPGFESADLEGVTVDYFVAEEGWHRLVDGRVLLVSTAELKDTGFAGKTFELGASFSDATTVVQLQRPMLKRWTAGEYYGISPGGMYMGAALVNGSGNFSSLHLRLMRDADTEGSSSDVFAGRVGFMVLGNVTSMERGFQIERLGVSVRHGNPLRAELSYFHNRYHSAATSPLLNKSGCGADDDVDDLCVFATPPVDTFSRGIFDTPRLPYVDADFEPLQSVRSFRMDKEDSEFGMNAHPHFGYWKAEVADALLAAPDNHYTGGKIQGAPARMHANIHAARGWDDNFFQSYWWLWLTLNHYDTCLFDGKSTACTDFAASDQTILGSSQINWTAWHEMGDFWDHSTESFIKEHGLLFPDDTSVSQKIFGNTDKAEVDSQTWQHRIQPPVWAADKLASYLNYELPGGLSWAVGTASSNMDPLADFLQEAPDLYNWEPWQIHGSMVFYRTTEFYYGTSHEYGPTSSTSFWYPRPEGASRTPEISPKAAPLTGLLRPEDYLFANVPWGVQATDFRWVRSASADGTDPVVVANAQFGYQATFADQGKWLAFCMTRSGVDTCSKWHQVSMAPVASDVKILSTQAVPVSGLILASSYSFSDPKGERDVSAYQWQMRVNNGAWQDIAGATENTFDGAMAADTDIRFCVTPATPTVTGVIVCSGFLTYDDDFDGDGIADRQDWDDDGDGRGDVYDAFPYDPEEWLDTDGDGIGNNADLDDDNDGLSDIEETTLGEDGFITNPLDDNTDDDGFLDGEDPSPTDALNRDWADTDGDLIHDDDDEDIDGDGVDNAADEAPFVACASNAITVTSDADSGPGTLREAMANLCANDQFSDLNVIDFAEAMTITLESPLLVTKGMKIDGASQVTIDGNNTGELFRVLMPEYLPGTQFLHLSGLTLTGGYNNGATAEAIAAGSVGFGSVVNTVNGRWTLVEFSLIADNQAPAFGSTYGSYTLENSVLARTYGDFPAIDLVNGRVQLFSTTLVDHESGTLRVTGDGEADLYNSLMLNGDSGTAACDVSNWMLRANRYSWVEDSACGVTSDGWVFLADPDNNDFRPIPGSASIDAGETGDPDAYMVDFLGNKRINGIFNPEHPDGPLYKQLDIGAIEYDPFGDFDADGVADSEDDFPSDPTETTDTDGDGTGDNSDAFVDDPAEWLDTDGDGIGNNGDDDDDNDGYSDEVETAEGSDPLSDASTPLDTDGDFLPNSTDSDDDNDGVADEEDAFPLDATETVDTDGDGIGNNADADDDGDGVTDDADAFPLDGDEWLDSDGDGIGNNADPDDDNDGVADDEEVNVAPAVTIAIRQNGEAMTTVFADGGLVQLVAHVTDENPNDTHVYDWSLTDSNLVPTDGYSSEVFSFDPSALSEGVYPLSVIVVDSGEGTLGTTAESLVHVLATAPVFVAGDDTDGDGIVDSDEGIVDGDMDRIPDYLDPVTDAHLLPADGSGALLQVEEGLQLILGDTAFAAGNAQALVTLQDLADHGGAAGGVGALTEDAGYEYFGGVFDFIVAGIEIGASAQIVIPQAAAIQADASYRKYVSGNGWQAFVEDANNSLASAPGALGDCPAPDDVAYTPGLTEGHYCVQLTIEDGGSNDADGVANGSIKDPGGVAAPIPAPNVSAAATAVADSSFAAGDGEKVVFGFALTSDSTDAEVSQLTIAASGDMSETGDIGVVRLYRDDNQDGIADAGEQVGEGSYDSDDGSITFELLTPYQLPVGETHFLVTYVF
ncbi:choice-of-anchor U domain-containing protein [Microbulbifer sp. SA54]|uniref:choice-of-anchor U domain-containing protein n=1 Tax=Microbulbifer sp. SA54 TaxID=3401577 RepID=UPI003AAF329E